MDKVRKGIKYNITITKLGRQFKKLLERNQELPSHLQLERKVSGKDGSLKKLLGKG